MNEKHINGDPFEEVPRFVPCALFERFGAQRVFYKGDAPSVKETKEEQALAEIAEQKWGYYQENYRPLEDEYMNRVDSLDSDGSYSFARGAAGSATSAAFDQPKQQMAEQLQGAGINPNSGKYKTAMAGLSDAQAVSSTDSQSRAQTDQQNQFVQGLSNISAMGRGQATTAQAGLTDVASLSASKAADDAASAWNDRAARNSSLGTVFGAGAKYYSGTGGLSSVETNRPDSTVG